LLVTGIDIAHNCLDSDVKIPFLKRCLWDLPDDNMSSDYAFCTDVLEHIPFWRVDKVLENMWERTNKAAFMQICLVPDTSGPKMDPPERLHLCVQPAEFWKDKLLSYWKSVEQLEVGGKARKAFLCFKE
jgi:hypothetical protein